jgi:two-component system sensor histidine kinase KdpD
VIGDQGHLKIFLGYASGVGKSFRMLDEARRRRDRGQDVVIGALQPAVPAEVEALLRKLEVIPLLSGNTIDVAAILRRLPAVCVVDGLAYNNPPGALHPTRWEDVREIVDAGVKVIGSINVQYIAELNAEVEAITGKRITETVPVDFLRSADEIEVVDAPATESPQLVRLRELALVLAADVVDRQLTSYLERHGVAQSFGAQERILVCVTPRSNAAAMIGTASTIAIRFHAELLVAYVRQRRLGVADQAALDAKLAIAHAAGACVEILEGEDAIRTLLDFARARGVTQLFIGHSQRAGLWQRMRGNPVDRLIRHSEGMDVRVFPQ